MSVESVEVESADTVEVWKRISPVDLPEDTQKCLVAMASKSDEEVCGFIDESGVVLPVPNVADDPKTEFRMDHDAMVKALGGGHRILGTYHSHPSGRPWPSIADTESITYLYKSGCPWRYFIVTRAGVFEFQHRDKAE